MKRKSGRKPTKKEEENSNGMESRSEQNGDTSDHDDEPLTPKNKKRKSSKWNRKSVSFSSKKEDAPEDSDKSEDEENDDDEKEEKKSSKASRKGKRNEDESHSEDEKEQAAEKKKSSKKGRNVATKDDSKDKGNESDDEDEDEDDESQYEVQSVLDEKMIKGVRHYLIRWKGYEEESDTWEPEGTLDCDRLIQEFKEKKKKSGGKAKKHKKDKKLSETQEWDENEDFEVDRILEVHHRKDGKREFLVSWKGYNSTENSWEPEENMDCKDLIQKFMAKVDKAKMVEERELRVNRPHVQRYTLSTQDSGRRLSKRFRGKERVQYHDAE